MRVLVGRGGQLVAPCSLVCGDSGCACHHTLTGLDSRAPVELVTVAERDDVTIDSLTADCALFVSGLCDDPDIVEACAADMATTAIEAAAIWPAGTVLAGRYELDDDATDHFDGGWTFTPQQ